MASENDCTPKSLSINAGLFSIQHLGITLKETELHEQGVQKTDFSHKQAKFDG